MNLMQRKHIAPCLPFASARSGDLDDKRSRFLSADLDVELDGERAGARMRDGCDWRAAQGGWCQAEEKKEGSLHPKHPKTRTLGRRGQCRTRDAAYEMHALGHARRRCLSRKPSK